MPTQNISLSEKQSQFIRQRVDEGDYRNASEVVRAGLRLLEQHEQEDKLKLRALRRLTRQAFADIDNGKFETVESGGVEKFLARADAKARASRS